LTDTIKLPDETPAAEKSAEELEKALVQARANLQLKETVVEATLVAQPILAAIHQEPNATAKER
jgi:hypothetical protein